MLPMLTAPRLASGAITLITPMLAPLTATTVQRGSPAASSSVRVPGTAGAGVTAGADTAIAAAGVIAADMAIEADTAAAIAVDTAAVIAVDMAAAIAADTRAAASTAE